MNRIDQTKLEMTTNVLAALMKGTDPQVVVSALNNVSCHGAVFFDGPLDGDEKFLEEWFEGIEKLQIAVDNARNR